MYRAILLGIISLLLLSFEAWGATYYLDPDWAGATNGTEVEPFNAVSQFLAVDLAGDSLLFKRGTTYTGTITLTLNDQTLGAYGTGAKPIIDGNDSSHCINLGSTTGWTVENLDVRDCNSRGIYAPNGFTETATSNGTVDGNSVSEMLTASNNGVGIVVYGTGVTITNNSVTDTDSDGIYHQGINSTISGNTVTRSGMSGAQDGDSIHVGSGSDNVTIEDNYLDHTTSLEKQGIAANGTNHKIRDNIVLFMVNPGTSQENNGIYSDASGTIIERNWISGARRGVRINANSIKVRSNIIVSAQDAGIDWDSSATTGIEIVNNTLFGGAGHGIDNVQTTGSSITVSNNSISGFTGTGLKLTNKTGITESNNNAYNNGTNFSVSGGEAASDTQSDPLYAGGPNPTTAEGFKPFATSPLCGAGYPTPAKYDYANKRLGNPPNIGAYGTCTAGRTSYSTRSTYDTR